MINLKIVVKYLEKVRVKIIRQELKHGKKPAEYDYHEKWVYNLVRAIELAIAIIENDGKLVYLILEDLNKKLIQ